MKIITNQDYITYMRKTKHYELTVDNKIEISLEKWWFIDDLNNEYENDYTIDDEEKVKCKFEDEYGEDWEDKWDKLLEYIDELE